MSNSYFRFKEFTVQQDRCAMKVCTDSCLFGAWTTDWLWKNKQQAQSILDIGAGTGLLSLMLAQKLPAATMDAVEIEPSCFEQAEANISQSLWKERIRLHHCDINEFVPQKEYDIIVSNPPFYESDLLSGNVAKNIAHHGAGLTLQTLLSVVKKHLKEDGCFSVLLPYHRSASFESAATRKGFFVIRKAFVKQNTRHSFFRTFLLLSKMETDMSKDEIVIKDCENHYSSLFITLLKDYYLHL